MPTGLPPETRRQRNARINRELSDMADSLPPSGVDAGNPNGACIYGAVALLTLIAFATFFGVYKLITWGLG